MRANDRTGQLAPHYVSEYQHWDLIIDAGLGPAYLVGVATKYVARWRKKDGIKDLQKSLHYIDKLLEFLTANPLEEDCTRPLEELGSVSNRVVQFAEVNDLNGSEQSAVYLLLSYEERHEVEEARAIVAGLILAAEKERQASETTPPVTARAEGDVALEDSNRHAPRA